MQSLESQASSSTSQSFAVRSTRIQAPDPAATLQEASPGMGCTSKPETESRTPGTVPTDPEMGAAVHAEHDAMSSLHEGVLRDLVAYASIRHEARAELQSETSLPHTESRSPGEGGHLVHTGPAAHRTSHTGSAQGHRYPSSVASSVAWGTDTHYDTGAAESEPSDVIHEQECRAARGKEGSILEHISSVDATDRRASQQSSASHVLVPDARADAPLVSIDRSSAEETRSGETA